MSRGPSSRPTDRTLRNAGELAAHASRLVPGGSQTGSKAPTKFVQGVSPSHIERAEGSHLWDADGNEYIECNAALGPIILGHGYPAVTDAVAEQLEDGTMYTMEHPLQVEVAELLVDAVPCAEMVQFAKSGNDVTALAAKLARAHTGRDVIATQGYHGWPDVWMGHTGNSAGIPDAVGEYTAEFDYNDVESVERIFEEHQDDVAAIVTTPVNLEEPEDDFLVQLREIAEREDAVLVFDEVLTGFRFALGGAQEYFGVTPDLACFAKAMANGFPVSALAGSREVMSTMSDDGFFFSMTYAGDAASLAASKATITTLRDEAVHDHIFRQGKRLRDGYNELAEAAGLAGHTEAVGFPPRFSISFDGEDENLVRSLFMQEAHERGVLFTGSHIPTYSLTDEDVERVLDVYGDCLEILASADDAGDIESRLRGDPIGSPLRDAAGDD